MYFLTRIKPDDRQGDSGGMSIALWMEGSEIKYEHDTRPRVGVCMRVGSLHARTMSWQDYWQTSYITKIISDEPEKVVFETQNSEYVWQRDYHAPVV